MIKQNKQLKIKSRLSAGSCDPQKGEPMLQQARDAFARATSLQPGFFSPDFNFEFGNNLAQAKTASGCKLKVTFE
ncbi:MAG: hypothetical protein AAF614_36515 [Chloroflexota bacterium]